MTEFIELISTCGFPIAACAIMFYQNSKMQQTLAELSNTLTLISERLRDVEDAIEIRKE